MYSLAIQYKAIIYFILKRKDKEKKGKSGHYFHNNNNKHNFLSRDIISGASRCNAIRKKCINGLQGHFLKHK